MGEEGVLTGVEIAQAGNALPHHLALTMEHRGNGSSAVLCCDDEENVVPSLFRDSQSCIGWENKPNRRP
jgi:hypothetical protein